LVPLFKRRNKENRLVVRVYVLGMLTLAISRHLFGTAAALAFARFHAQTQLSFKNQSLMITS
jgi:hypothetical protein